ncbi:MAG: hypothetical protein MJ118_01550 [Clostridia bacterium]|nr:hypothetical protein [Clostridia bacterium]
MSKMLIGWAETDITPSKKISLAGQFAERISEYVEKPLTVTAMAVEAGGEQMVIVGCDLAKVPYLMIMDLRARLEGNDLGLDPMKIIVSAIHTHTGPVFPGGQRSAMQANVIGGFRETLQQFLKPGQKYVEKVNISNNPEIATEEEVYEKILSGVTEAILTAWKNRKPGSFSNAFNRAAVGMCRRAGYSDDTAQMWGDTNTAVFTELEGGNDSGIELLYVFGENKELNGIIVNLACPAQCVQHRLFVSPDFWGEAKMLIRKHFGRDIFVLPQCSAAGDQCPVDLVRWVQPYSDINDPNCLRNNPPKRKADPSMFDLEGMRKAGKRVANAVIEAYEDGLDNVQEDVPFVHHVHNMQLPLRRATLTDLHKAQQNIKDYLRDHPGDVDYNDVANLQVNLGVLRRFELQEKLETLDTEVHVVRLGSVAFATNPFELFLDYGNQIKARALCEQTFLVQLCNGSEGYLPTEKAERHGHYSAFIASGQVGHAGGELLVRETLKDINSLFAED